MPHGAVFNWVWLRRTIDRNFDKLLLTGLVGVSIVIACLGDLTVMWGHRGFNLVSREWLREQTALLIGALLGLMRGHTPGDYPDVPPLPPLEPEAMSSSTASKDSP
jgi:hypothetical protein